MTGMIRKATLLVALGLVAASTAMAGIPDAAHCTVPTWVEVVGTNAGVPDPRGTFTVTVRDIGNIPISGSVVTLNFTACTDMKLCSGAGVTCPFALVSATTLGSGVATFTVIGGGLHPGGVFAGPSTACCEIRADGYLLGSASVNVYDLNGARGTPGSNGCTIADLPLWMADWAGGSGPYKCRSDYDHNTVPFPAISIADLPYWMQIWGPSGSVSGCMTSYCP